MPLQLPDLSLDLLAASGDGAPLLLPIEAIDEDPEQPRIEFDAESLQQLAATIAERGVRQPISVRSNPQVPGRWRLNFGARRLRASAIAGRTLIPAFVDETADHYDQVIENEQRDRLTSLELSLFVARRLRAGETQADIARKLGKSRQHVLRATALIDPPDWLAAAYRTGVCRGLNELYELRRLHQQHPTAVESWIGSQEAVNRGDLVRLGRELERLAAPHVVPGVSGKASPSANADHPAGPAPADTDRVRADRRSREPKRESTKHYKLMATWNGASVVVLLDQGRPNANQIAVRARASSVIRDAPISELHDLRLEHDTAVGHSE